VKRLENGLLEIGREEGVFIWRFKAPNEGIKLLTLANGPVKKAKVAIGYVEGPSFVDCAVEGKLNTFNEMEGD